MFRNPIDVSSRVSPKLSELLKSRSKTRIASSPSRSQRYATF